MLENKITPFLCETIFTLEAIQKRDRKNFFSEYKPHVNATEESNGRGIKLSMSIGPDSNAHPGNNSFLEKHLRDAIEIGFQIIKLLSTGQKFKNSLKFFYFSFNVKKNFPKGI